MKTLLKHTGITLVLFVALIIGGCDLFDVENPNNLVESDLDNPASASAMANGLEFSVTRAVSALLATYGTATDEVTWVGSRDAWRNLDIGDLDDPLNEFSNGLFPFVGEARWLSEDFVRRIEDFRSAGVLQNNEDLMRAYLYRGIIHTVIADMYDDFAFSNRDEGGPPIGPANMVTLYDMALDAIDKAIALGPDGDLLIQVQAMRARVNYSKAVWGKVKPSVNTADPLVNNAAAVADAQAALALMGSADWIYELELDASLGFPDNSNTFSLGFQVNNRSELRFGITYIEPTSNGRNVESVTFADIIDTDVVQPFVENTINEFESEGDYPDFTVVSAREMHLIIAEAALAAGDDAGFTDAINAIRAFDGLTAYSGQVDAQAVLAHTRQANLFNQGRRLMDMYRFAQTSPEWEMQGTTMLAPGTLFPIADVEVKSNPFLQP